MMKRVLLSGAFFIIFFCGVAYSSEVVQFEYDGRIIEVRLEDLIVTEDGLQLFDPYAEEYDYFGQPTRRQEPNRTIQRTEITEEQYREQQRGREWLNIVENLELREIDRRALEIVDEFNRATGAVSPHLSQTGSLVIAFSTYIPKIVCRPMYITDVILERGEEITGIHPGDTSRWTFTPGVIGEGANRQISVLIKPMMADISTNLIIMTNRRRYHLDLMSSSTNYMPSVSFTYPQDGMRQWDEFIRVRNEERARVDIEMSTGHNINPEDLHLSYSIEGGDNIRWKPINVFDDGVKTYIRFPSRSTIRSVEAPIFVVFERRREIIVNYRFVEDMMIVDRVFDVGGLIIGTGAAQTRVTIRRLR